MKIEELIIQKITEYVRQFGKSADVILINPITFKAFAKEIKKVYDIPFEKIEPGSFRFMGMRVCRTPDIKPGLIEVY